MASKAILIQQVYQGSEYAEALALTYGRNLAYCQKYNMDYFACYSNIRDDWDWRLGGWAKLVLIRDALNNGYQYVIWLDADSLIADLNTDLRDGCPEFGVGMVHHNPIVRPVYNVGVMYFTNSERVRQFVNDWIGWFPGPVNGWHEQAMLSLLSVAVPYLGLVVPLENKWNSCVKGLTHVDNAVVEGFHGEGEISNRIKLMKEWLDAYPV